MNEIGEILKEARIEKGYTLDDLQQITKIQKRYLQAIEDGNTDILPGRFYARAFVKQYADIVGLDGEQLLEEHVGESSKDASEEFAEKVNAAPTRSTQVKRGGGGSTDWQENLPTILIFLLVAAIFIVIYVAWRQTDDPAQNENSMINEENTEQVGAPVTEESNEAIAEPTENTAEETEEASEENEETEQTEDEAEEEEEEPEEQEVAVAESTGVDTTYEVTGPHPEEQNLTLSASEGDSWVSVSIDGGSEQAQMLSDGDELSVDFGSDVEQIDIVVGNAPVTTLVLNDQELPEATEAADNVRQDVHLQFTQE